ncbi:MAG: calcium-binding protein [Nostoc sp.]|uniref:calcium-binding protein n=1 Tax=Nostoc sp. TaxID=1180 RepID=UPI002FF5DC4A
MAILTFNGTNGPDRPLTDYNGRDYLDTLFDQVFINGFDGDDVIGGVYASNYIIFGGAGNDTLLGYTNDDVLIGDDFNGSTGNDSLFGDSGNDLLNGGAGNDTLNGGTGNDTLFAGTGNDILVGGTGNDTLYGRAGNDTLNGGAGNDILVGGTGNDILTGGAGGDRFTFDSRSEGIDRITDFSVVDDTIIVSAAGFGGGLVAGAAIAANKFVIGTAATTSSQRFIYNKGNGFLFFDQDGTGAIAKIQIATLNTGLSLSNADIYVTA